MSLSWEYSESSSNINDVRTKVAYKQENDFSLPFRSSVNTTSVKPKSKTPCKFFFSGKCSFGSRCQFVHAQNASNTSEFCSFYKAGNCKYGSSCALKHGNEASDYKNEASDYINVSNDYINVEKDLRSLTSSLEKLDVESSSFRRSDGRNSLLPSFLVDELLLDEDEHHQQHQLSNHLNQRLKPEHFFCTESDSEPVVFFDRSISVSSSSNSSSPFEFESKNINAYAAPPTFKLW